MLTESFSPFHLNACWGLSFCIAVSVGHRRSPGRRGRCSCWPVVNCSRFPVVAVAAKNKPREAFEAVNESSRCRVPFPGGVKKRGWDGNVNSCKCPISNMNCPSWNTVLVFFLSVPLLPRTWEDNLVFVRGFSYLFRKFICWMPSLFAYALSTPASLLWVYPRNDLHTTSF